MSRLPVPVDHDSLSKRLTLEEKYLLQSLAQLEDRVRKFEDFEHTAYENWFRLEFGPELMALQQTYEIIRERQILVRRINELIETDGFTPREALYVALNKNQPTVSNSNSNSNSKKSHDHDADEIAARRRAKLESKRAVRREEKKQKKKNNSNNNDQSAPRETKSQADPNRNRMVSLYRNLARRLHPDSPLSIKDLPTSRVLNLWFEVHSAYHSANYERLVAITAWLDQRQLEDGASQSTPFGLSFSASFSERFERIRSMTKSCSRLKKRITELETHPAWNFLNAREPLNQKVNLKTRRRAAKELEEETAHTRLGLEALNDFIESIGTAKPPRERGRRH